MWLPFCSVTSLCRWATRGESRKKGNEGLLIGSSRVDRNQGTCIILTLKATPATRNNKAHLRALQYENWAGHGRAVQETQWACAQLSLRLQTHLCVLMLEGLECWH